MFQDHYIFRSTELGNYRGIAILSGAEGTVAVYSSSRLVVRELKEAVVLRAGERSLGIVEVVVAASLKTDEYAAGNSLMRSGMSIGPVVCYSARSLMATDAAFKLSDLKSRLEATTSREKSLTTTSVGVMTICVLAYDCCHRDRMTVGIGTANARTLNIIRAHKA